VDHFAVALGLALLPALGNFGGGLLAEAVDVSRRVLSYALHVAAGIVLAVIGLELLPKALAGDTPWIPVLAFVAGGAFFIALDAGIGTISARLGHGSEAAGPWVIYAGVALDLFSDGIMIGTGAVISSGLALLLALGQVSADVPEGFAVVANFKEQGVPRAQRLLISAAFAVPILLGATIGYWAVRGQPPIVKFSLLAFTAGVLLTVVIEEIVPEAHEGKESRWAALALVSGFALFALVSAYFGS
jgi:ZIP family zinc transporter